MKKSFLFPLLFVTFLILVCVFSLVTFKGVKPLPIDVDKVEFSAERAFIHTKEISQKPHSIGSEEHGIVKQYIIDQLIEMGLDTMLHNSTTFYDKESIHAGYVQNVIGILPGTERKKAIMYIGHYDTQPNTLGAADDGVAVASMLELARALTESEKLKNDIIFLFSDGEEAGLFGAKAFVEDEILKDKIGIIYNIEARGSSGPNVTYEISPENGWLMREFKKCVSNPYATSISYEISRMLPNDSDFTPFRKAGFSGFNNAFLDDFVNYHSMTDSPENLDLRSLQHHGSNMIDIAKHFGNQDLTNAKSKDVVFFNFIGSWMILYSIGLNYLFEIIILLLFVFYILLGIRYKQLKIWKSLVGFFAFVLFLVITLGILMLIQKWILNTNPHYEIFYGANFYNINYYQLGFTLLAIGLFSLLYSFIMKWLKIENLLTGVILFLFVLMIALQVMLPSAPYLAIVPLFLLLIPGIISFQYNWNFEKKQKQFYLIYAIALFPLITMFAPFTKLLFVTFGLETILAGVALVCLILGFLLYFIHAFHSIQKFALPVLAIIIGFGAIISGNRNAQIDESQPLQSNVMYCFNADDSSAVWTSRILETDDWNQQFFKNPEKRALKEIYPQAERERLIAKADVYDMKLPQFLVLFDTITNGKRQIELLLQSNRLAEYCNIYINKKAKISDFKLNNKSIKSEEFYAIKDDEYHKIEFHGIYEQGINLAIKCDTVQPLEIIVFDKKLGLPLGNKFKPMPKHIIPYTGWESRVSLIRKTFVF